MFVDRCMDTEIVVHIYNGIFLSPEMHEMCRCSNISGPREDHTKWSESDTGSQTLHRSLIWEIYKWIQWHNLLKGNRFRDFKTNLQIPRESLWSVEGKTF